MWWALCMIAVVVLVISQVLGTMLLKAFAGVVLMRPSRVTEAISGEGGPCPDLRDGRLYHDAVRFCRLNGLLRGADDAIEVIGTVFEADVLVTYQECRAALARLRDLLDGTQMSDSLPLAKAKCCYECVSVVNREQFVAMLVATLDVGAFLHINDLSEVPGGFGWTETGKDVLALYRAGVLIGDECGYFSPFKPITRGEVAVILMRCCLPSARVRVELPFSSDESVALREINLSTEATEWLFGERVINRTIEFDGHSIFVKASKSADEHLIAVYDLDSPVPVPMPSNYPPSGHYLPSMLGAKHGFSDGVLLNMAEGDTFRFIDHNGQEIDAGKQIYDATPFNEGYAAVRYTQSTSGTVQVIDKNGNKIVELPGGYLLHRIYPSDGIIQGFASFLSYQRYPMADVVVRIDTGEVMKAAALFDKPVVMTSEFHHGLSSVNISDYGTRHALSETQDLVNADFDLLGLNLDISNYSIEDWNEDYVIVRDGSNDCEHKDVARDDVVDMLFIDIAKRVTYRVAGSRMMFSDILGMPNSTVALTQCQESDGGVYIGTVICDAISKDVLSIIPLSSMQSENCLLVVSEYSYDGEPPEKESRCITDIYGNRLSPILQNSARYIPPGAMTDPERKTNDGILFFYNSNVYHVRSNRVYNYD